MKMEYHIKATHDAEVSEVLAIEGQFVEMRQKLIMFKWKEEAALERETTKDWKQ